MSAILWIITGICMMAVGVTGFVVSQILIGRWVKSLRLTDNNNRRE